MRSAILLVCLAMFGVLESTAQIVVSDRFGRDLSAHSLRLVDWEGQIANPAVEFSISVPEEWRPATVEIHSGDNRIHFADRLFHRSEPSIVDQFGSSVTIRVEPGVEMEPVRVAIWPDRDGLDEAHTLWIGVYQASGAVASLRLPVIVEDHDSDRPADFPVTLDTSHDDTAFFTNPTVKAVTQQAADDWGYFLSGDGLDEVQRGASLSWIWNEDGFNSGRWVTNAMDFRGFLLYGWGMRHVNVQSGGAASGGYQTIGGWPISIMNAGYAAMEIRGNENVLGWSFLPDSEWWVSDNHPRGVADFYSLVHHQIGHAMFFSGGHLEWHYMKSQGGSTAAPVMKYLGGPAIIDRYDHIYDRGNGEHVVDPASRRGVFGSETAEGAGIMTPRRWIITKTDLLMAQEVGYTLRETSAFNELRLITNPPSANESISYAHAIAVGGVADYLIEVISGDLPAGLTIDTFSGVISGQPTQSGSFPLTIRATDQLGVVVEGVVNLSVGTTLQTQQESVKPEDLSLMGYPNPTSGSALFEFETSQAGSVRLEVYDLMGRRVASLVDRMLGAGRHEANWDTAGLPAGTYIARLAGPESISTRALTVLR